jgi:hypothetical protein
VTSHEHHGTADRKESIEDGSRAASKALPLAFGRFLRMMPPDSLCLPLELCRRRNDLLGQPLHITLDRLGVAWNRTNHQLVDASITVTFHLV